MGLTWRQALAWRMERQLLEPVGTLSVPRVVRRLCAVQAQVASSAELAVCVRRTSSTAGEVTHALAQGRLVKTWAMRGTLHLLTPEDAGIYLSLIASAVVGAPELAEVLRGLAHADRAASLGGARGLTRKGADARGARRGGDQPSRSSACGRGVVPRDGGRSSSRSRGREISATARVAATARRSCCRRRRAHVGPAFPIPRRRRRSRSRTISARTVPRRSARSAGGSPADGSERAR
ncbi:MAG: DNA glycosylase AlkZ-like family protein [Actinomycetota bacterium]